MAPSDAQMVDVARCGKGSVSSGSTLAEGQVSRMKRIHQAASARDRVRHAAAQVKPLARTTGAAARRRVHRTRAWAAPQLERTGQVLQDTIAPKVSAVLSSVAQRLEPAQPRRRRWRKLAGGSLLPAAARAVAARVLKRRKPDATTPAGEDADEVTPAAHTRDEQAKTGPGADADADVNGRVRTS